MAETISTEADRALKEAHRAMWALGDYPAVALKVIPDLGAVLVDACEVRSGDRVLDVAAGSGNVAIPAALAGASVIACDLTPELFAAGQAEARRRGATVEWREADAEALPFGNDEFDIVSSCVGVMFAPHHRASADELIRVCRPGGMIGLISWTPEGFVGQMLTTMRPYVAPPPPGVESPPLWGNEEHVRGLFDERVENLHMNRRNVIVDCFADAESFRDFFKSHYGPTVAAYRSLESEPDRCAALDRDLADFARRGRHGSLGFVMEWEYLLVTGRKAS